VHKEGTDELIDQSVHAIDVGIDIDVTTTIITVDIANDVDIKPNEVPSTRQLTEIKNRDLFDTK